ncbi:AraC family transcriptional regulator [Arcticibacterium luteifluviistationis]|uniref:AraC family transcriptional regulator n=1 Tax=Arcticibacterium luteifluviistationis TaxID=1784714 RepID=A0A2Z4GI28_9BACT|nr:helix-turn-helix transcriptional regulator [Arcticibacterium luteifluviistationis]AWW00738.1 AraC family transcriptional regulator [Arcticibacterium luteifluviistationis]
MKNIPNISFKSIENKTDFDFLNLSKLFPRLDTIEDHNPTLPHRISFFALLIVTKGTGKHQIDLKEYDLIKGTVLKIAQGQVHAFQKNPTYEGFLIIFTNDFVMNYIPKSSINLISHLYNYHLTSPVTIDQKGNEEFIKQISSEIESRNTYAQSNIIAAYLNLYLLKLERIAHYRESKDLKPKKHDTFIEFKNLVESNYTTTRNVKDYADLMLISTKSLNQVVQEFTINTAKSFIDNYVILEAKRDLVSTSKSIKEIAFALGFDEVTNFTKFFKKHTMATPKEFKMEAK